MIFCKPEEVNDVWSSIAKETANANLGTAAKVAPDNGSDRSDRLICVYTKDFNDEEDVSRVLHKLKELGVIEKSKPIYYKCGEFLLGELYLDLVDMFLRCVHIPEAGLDERIWYQGIDVWLKRLL